MRRTETAVMQANPSPPARRQPATAPGFRLDLMAGRVDPEGMKTLVAALAGLLLMSAANASDIRISGTPSWTITKPDCTFKLDGAIQNLSPSNTSSGSLKLVLWATLLPFPSRGYPLAEVNIGQLPGGYQLDNFTRRTTVKIPEITGEYHFTIAVLEYTLSGWQTRAFTATGKKRLDAGNFTTGAKWVVPSKAPKPPPSRLKVGDKLAMTPRADAELDGITPGTDAKTTATINAAGKTSLVYGSRKSTASYAYSVAPGTLNGAKYSTGKLVLNPSSSSQSATILLYFQSPISGVYKRTENGRVTWGLFRYN